MALIINISRVQMPERFTAGVLAALILLNLTVDGSLLNAVQGALDRLKAEGVIS